MAQVIGYKNKIYPKGTGGGGSGSSGVYVEDELYTATSNSFVDITVDWNWDDYDFYVFWVHDNPYTQRCGDTTILTKKQIKHLVDNSMDNVFYRYDNNYVIYTFGSNQLITTAKNGNHVIIQIIGVKTSGDYYSPVIYSTEEREIGVWTDNKPLYQKTYIGTWQLNGTSWSGTLVNIPNAELKNTECLGSDWQSMGVNGNIDSNGNLTLYNLRSTTLTAIAVTIQYTKTTDVAGSGSYNTLGVPTVHYTTNEQVIGTWIDGKPLYRRTWEFSTGVTVSSNSWKATDIAVADTHINVITDCKALNDDGQMMNYISATTDLATQTYVMLFNSRTNAGIVVKYLTLEYTKTTDV